MFPDSDPSQRPIAPALLPLAQKIEERSPGLYVLAAREFRYPVQEQQVSIRVDQYRKVNLLEKFVLRASADVSPAPSLEEVASALGIDPIFIRSTFQDLLALQRITYADDSLQVTAEGRKTLASEILPQEPLFDTWYFLQDLVLDTAGFSHRPLEDAPEELEDLSTYIQKDLTAFPDFAFHPAELQTQLRELGLEVHNPDEGQFVTDMAPSAPPERRWKPIAIFVLYDTLSERADTSISFQARSGQQALPRVGEWLEAQLQENNLSLKTLCGLSEKDMPQEAVVPEEDNPEERLVEERLEGIRQQAASDLRLKVSGQTLEPERGTALQLRDVEIRSAFLTALQEAREQIIIFSPWINEQVMDDGFLALLETLVEQGVRILIGYGIGREESREERPIPPELLQRLRAIHTSLGTPGIIAEWLGNSHAKEIIIDRKIHFSGSHNWLSYRGDRLPRGETVYKVTIVTEVEKAYTHLARRFVDQAKILWASATSEEEGRALCILGALGQEQEAVEWIQRDVRYDVIPLWLTLAQQAVAARQETRLITPLHQTIKLCATALESNYPLPSEIGPALERVLRRMALHNQALTVSFVQDSLPLLKQLGVSLEMM